MIISYSNNGVNVATVRKPKTPDETISPIYWRITHQRKQIYLFTGLSFSADEWEEFTGKNKQRHKDDKTILRRYLDGVIRPIVDELVSVDGFTLDAFKTRINGGSRDSVNNAFENRIKALDDAGQVGNSIVYSTAYGALIRYQYYRKLKDKVRKDRFLNECREGRHMTKGSKVIEVTAAIPFSDITVKWLNDCEQFLRDMGLSDASIGLYMRTFRALINNRGGDPYLIGAKYPFGVGKYEIPEGGRKETALSIEDIRKIEEYAPRSYSQEIARDIFMFLFYGNGMNFGDMCRLQYSNIDSATKEIVFQRKKTLKRGERPTYIYVPILDPMIEIINKHGNKKQDGYIFPFLNGVEGERNIKEKITLSLAPINEALKSIAATIDIDPGLSTGYARNSYITHLTAELMISPIVVRKMVGHSTRQDVTAGYVNLTPKKRRSINDRLMREPDNERRKRKFMI